MPRPKHDRYALLNQARQGGPLCLNWDGYSGLTSPKAGECSRRPYIHIAKGVNILAYRWVWEETFGPIPSGLEISHACRNSMCVNVDHMALCRPWAARHHDRHLPKKV